MAVSSLAGRAHIPRYDQSTFLGHWLKVRDKGDGHRVLGPPGHPHDARTMNSTGNTILTPVRS